MDKKKQNNALLLGIHMTHVRDIHITSCTRLDKKNANTLNEDWKQVAKSRKINTQSYLRTLLARQMGLCMSQ